MLATPVYSAEEITAEGLTQILSQRDPGVAVCNFTVLERIDGTGTKLKLKLDYASDTSLPTIMWFKAGFESAHAQQLLDMGVYALEALFYDKFQPLLRIRSPQCFGTIYDEHQGTILLQDLQPPKFEFAGFGEPYSLDLVADGLAGLADMHGRSWEQPWIRHPAVRRLMEPSAVKTEHFRRSYPVSYLQAFIEGPVGEVIPPEARDAQRIYDVFWALAPHFAEGPTCMIHGDNHPGNTYVEDGVHLGFLDWQMLSIGPCAHDVAYLLAGALSVEDRRKHERDLVKEYLERLRSHSVDYSFDELWLGYRRFLAWGFYIWLRNPGSMQPLEYNRLFTARYAPAAVDHEVFKLHGV